MKRRLDIHVRLDNGSKGPLLAKGYTRLVVGGRGSYIEIDPEQIERSHIEPEPGQEYRFHGKWREKAFYGWHRTKVAQRKVYEQFRHVGYADYVPGYFYVSPDDVVFEGELYVEEPDVPKIDFDA